MPGERYEKIQKIGQGNFGTVWKARDKKTGLTVAIKIIDLENSGEEIEEVQKEIKALSKMNSKNVTKYHESFVEDNYLWIIMEYLGGGSVRDVIVSNQEKGIDEVYIAIILKEVLTGLKYMHSIGQIHRDIKSANILLASNGDVKLADFGVVGQLTDEVNKRTTVVGTPWWMAPEVIIGKPYNNLADIWSVGITAMEMALGRPPLSRHQPTKALFLIPKKPPPMLRGNYSEALKDFVELCLQKDPEDRPTASLLLETAFIRTAKNTRYLTELTRRNSTRPHLNQTENDSKEEDDEDEEKQGWNFPTMIVSKPNAQAPGRPISNIQPEEELKIDETEDESSGELTFGTIVQRPKPQVQVDVDFESLSEASENKEPSYEYQHPMPAKIRRLFENLQSDNKNDRALCQSINKLRTEVERLNDNYVNKTHQLTESDAEIRKLKTELSKRMRRDRVKSKRREKKKRPGHTKSADSTIK